MSKHIYVEPVKIVFDYRFNDDEPRGKFQLVVDRTVGEVTNELLFEKLYALLVHAVNVLSIRPSAVIDHHYEQCTYSKFAFTTELAAQYREAKKNNRLYLKSLDVNLILDRWLEEHERNSVIYEGTIRKAGIVDEEDAQRMEVPVGTPYTYIPEPQSNLEAFQRLKFLTGQQVCEFKIREFKRNHINPSSEIYLNEVSKLKQFIESVNISDIDAAFASPTHNYQHEYLRIVNGYYDNHRCEQAMGSIAAQVYGTYILYKKWLEERLSESFIAQKSKGLPMLEPGPISDNALLSRETYELLFKRSRLSDFFLVPAPPLAGRFWYDINDQATSDPSRVVRVSEINISQTKRAKESDFVAIHDRVSIIGNTSTAAYRYFIADLIECIKTMVVYHQTLYKPEEREQDHYELLELADRFLSWLESKIILCTGLDSDGQTTVVKRSVRLTQRAIALVCVYMNRLVTRENCNQIAAEYGHKSGGKIYNSYTHFSKRINVIGTEATPVKDKNKVNLLETVIDVLQHNQDGLARAEADLVEFKKAASLD